MSGSRQHGRHEARGAPQQREIAAVMACAAPWPAGMEWGLRAGIALAWPVVSEAQAFGMLPGGRVWLLCSSGAVILGCAAGLIALRAARQRQWRESGGRSTNPASRPGAVRPTPRLNALEAGLAAAQARLDDYDIAWAAMSTMPPPARRRRLRLVSGDDVDG